MKNYNPIATGAYTKECVDILKDLGLWRKMTIEEKSFFHCRRCKKFSEYELSGGNSPCPCLTCEHGKTEIQVDNRKRALIHKY